MSSEFDFNPLIFRWNILELFLLLVSFTMFVSFSKLYNLHTIKKSFVFLLGVFLLLKCRQKWIFSNTLLNSFLQQISAQQMNPQITYIGGRNQTTINTNTKKLFSTIHSTVHWFISIYMTAVQICFLCNLGKHFVCK
jgi:hypothetical protein